MPMSSNFQWVPVFPWLPHSLLLPLLGFSSVSAFSLCPSLRRTLALDLAATQVIVTWDPQLNYNCRDIFSKQGHHSQVPGIRMWTKLLGDHRSIPRYPDIYGGKSPTYKPLSCELLKMRTSKEPEPVPSTSGVSESAACPPSPVADDPSALSPTCSLLQSVALSACSINACTRYLFSRCML